MIVADAPIRVMVSDEAVITSVLPTLKATPVALSVSVDALPKVSSAPVPSKIELALPLTCPPTPASNVIVSLLAVTTSSPIRVMFWFTPVTVATSPRPKTTGLALPLNV